MIKPNLEKLEELEKAAKPLLDFLYKYGSPYTRIIVEVDKVEVTEHSMYVPIEVRD